MDLYKHNFGIMGGPACVMFYAPSKDVADQLMDDIYKELHRLNDKYSNYSAHSYVADINRSAGKKEGIVVDEETATLLDYSQACYQISDGLFDITTGVLYKAWDFGVKNPTLPPRKKINSLLEKVGWHRLQWANPHLVMPIPGMTIDFGGVVKEYAVDRVVSICYAHNVYHGVVELGGDICVLGPKPDGEPWAIGVTNPFTRSESLFTFTLAQGGVATSGDYARYIDIDGERYCHILNPKTGMPIKKVGSVTVVASPCLVAGSLSTISFLKEEQGVQWLKDQGLPFAFVGNDRSLAYSGLEIIMDPRESMVMAA